MHRISKIISGGQTGTDRAAFDFALATGIEISGFVPLGRRAEDGSIPPRYPNLTETETRNYAERTELNVMAADATLILSHGPLTGGSRLTAKLADKHQKPFLHVDFLEETFPDSVERAKKWLTASDCRILNVAGPRASTDPDIYRRTGEFLRELLKSEFNEKKKS